MSSRADGPASELAGATVNPRPGLRWFYITISAACTALIVNQFVLRFFLPTDLLAAFTTAEIAAHDAAAFRARWPVFFLYALGSTVALLTGPQAIADNIAGRRTAHPVFLGACLGSAAAGAGIAASLGAESLGGSAILFYWYGVALLWSFSVGMVYFGRARRSPLVARDWTLYSYAIAAAPLTFYATVPLWVAAAHMDREAAYLTGATIGLPAHLLIAHYVIVEILDRPQRRGSNN